MTQEEFIELKNKMFAALGESEMNNEFDPSSLFWMLTNATTDNETAKSAIVIAHCHGVDAWAAYQMFNKFQDDVYKVCEDYAKKFMTINIH